MHTLETLMALADDYHAETYSSYNTRATLQSALSEVLAERDTLGEMLDSAQEIAHKVKAERDALAKERDANTMDALRYNFLAKSGMELRYCQHKRKTWFAVINPMTNYEYDYEESLADAIDSAMKGQTP
jgi:hypothetical protein